MKKLNEYLITSSQQMSRVEYYSDESRSDWIFKDELRNNLCDAIIENIKPSLSTDNPNYVEKRMSVYVFNPDEFWEIVNQEAFKIANMMGTNAIISVELGKENV